MLFSTGHNMLMSIITNNLLDIFILPLNGLLYDIAFGVHF